MTVGAGYRWEEADRIFEQALDLPPGERARWLDQACGGNAPLREQVDSLLRADSAAHQFLELDALRCAAGTSGPALAGPDAGRIGPYGVVRELARGGMGVVYLAERADGQFRQRVALKLIKRGMDSDAIHRRFLAERQILAQLNHPNIARLLDGGVTPDGQPYFAIEYVDGTTITDHAQARNLGVAERLRLFLAVCDAVRYAHQNLVVHRDLKPSNILVTADGQVKLLDFGIAKLLRQEPGDTGLTETGLRVMTPEYAAPEQVSGMPVTTATDVYALGAVLYELLTGCRVHRFESYTPSEIERVVCRLDPEAPSGRVAGSLSRRLRGDLDTITLTALRKEPERRYPTVEQLASDVRRHLEGLPVTARPDTWRYRAGKFARRHRLAVAAGAAVALSLLAGLGGTIWQARVAAQRARVATAEATKERAVRDFLIRLFEAASPGNALGRDLTARELLDRGRRELDTALAAQPPVRAELLTVVANVYAGLGLLSQADTLFGQAIGLAKTLPAGEEDLLGTALTERASNLIVQSQFDRAEPLLEEAIGVFRRRDPNTPDAAYPLKLLGRIQSYTGNHARGEALLRQVLAIDLRHRGAGSREVADDDDMLGYELLRQGKLAAADSAIGAALALWRTLLPPDHPSMLWTLGNLAQVRRAQGAGAEAERLFREVIARQHRVFPQGSPELIHSVHDLGMLLAEQDRYAEADSLTQPEVAKHLALLGPDNDHVGMMLMDLAGYRYQLGRFAEAEHGLREALGVWRRRFGEDNRQTLGLMAELGVYLREQGRYREAEGLILEALSEQRRTLGDSHKDVARSLYDLGVLKRLTGEVGEAERLLRDALAIDRAAVPPGSKETARVLGELGAVLNRRGKATEAEPMLREALGAGTGPPGLERHEICAMRRELGYSLALQGRYADAERLLLAGYRDLEGRQDYWSARERRETVSRLVELYRRQGRLVEAARYRRALQS